MIDDFIKRLRRVGKAMATAQARVVLSVVYWLAVIEIAFLRNFFVKKTKEEGWYQWTPHADTLEELRKQF